MNTFATTHSRSPVRAYLLILAYFFSIMAVFRIIFWVYVFTGTDIFFSHDTLKAFYIGLRFDARIAALFTLPFGFFCAVPPLARALSDKAKLACKLYAVPVFLLITVYAVDMGFYQYLNSRVSALLFELLEDFQASMAMTAQSYPVGWIALGVLIASALTLAGLYGILRRPLLPGPTWRARALGFAGGFLVFALAVYGQLNQSFFPLRWSNAYFTTNEAIIALGLNPVQSLYDTSNMRTNDFSLEKTQAAYPRMAEFLKIDSPDIASLSYNRSFAAHPKAAKAPNGKPLNVIIIVMESLGYPKTSFVPGPLNPTPHIQALADESLLFHRYFANARTTARGIFSLITGIPDVNQGSTGSRNPQVVDQRVIANEFTGYERYYLIGGNTSWANIRAVLGRNIDGLRIVEEDTWKSPRADVWGISDYDLLREAHDLFAARETDAPFLAVIQTAGYHRPFTVPETPGFTHESISEADAAHYHFDGEKEYNSLRFSDFALGNFMRLAKSADYYQNTVFIVTGDHGINDPSAHMPAGYNAANLAPWHVPLIIHAAPELGIITPGNSLTPGSHVDIFPTAAGLAGIAYTDYTLGRDLFDSRYNASRQVYIGGANDTPIRLVEDGFCYYDNLLGTQALFHMDDAEGKDFSKEQPEKFSRMQEMANDVDATIRYMLYNNKKTLPTQKERAPEQQ